MKTEFLREADAERMALKEVLEMLRPMTPMGMEQKSKMTFFKDISALQEEYHRISEGVDRHVHQREAVKKLEILFAHMKDLRHSIQCAAKEQVLSTVELFEMKACFRQMGEIKALLQGLYDDSFLWHLHEIGPLIDLLDPKKDGLENFYIYDEFSDTLTRIRNEKRAWGKTLKTQREALKKTAEETLSVKLNGDMIAKVSKEDEEKIKKIEEANLLMYDSETYMQIHYRLKENAQTNQCMEELEALKQAEEEEMFAIRKHLSKEIGASGLLLQQNYQHIGNVDFIFAKARLALLIKGRPPILTEAFEVMIEEGVHPAIAMDLEKEQMDFQPLSISLQKQVTCITGANMGGKTVCLKTISVLVAMVHLGLMVPCQSMRCGLCEKLTLITGDGQSTKKGLSTFGSEITELKDAIQYARRRTLLLVDELASGTNPEEGQAILIAIRDYLKDKKALNVLTTHYDKVAEGEDIAHYQVRGLEGVSFETGKALKDEKERLSWLRKNMDYRLKPVSNESDVPKDAIRIAEMMGLNKEVLAASEYYLKNKKNRRN